MKEMLDLDMRECIDRAVDVRDFYRLMRELGYKVDYRCKYPSFLPPGGKRPLRLKKDGQSMTEDDIEEMLWDSYERQTEILVPKSEKPFVPYQKQHGFRALVLSWMYVLGWIGKGKKIAYRVDREEVRKLKRYIRQHDLLEKYGIDYEDQLDAHAAKRSKEYAELEERREALRKARGAPKGTAQDEGTHPRDSRTHKADAPRSAGAAYLRGYQGRYPQDARGVRGRAGDRR